MPACMSILLCYYMFDKGPKNKNKIGMGYVLNCMYKWIMCVMLLYPNMHVFIYSV